MFGLFKSDPTKKLQRQHDQLLQKGVDAQRKGDMRLYAQITSQAEELSKQIDTIKKANEANK
ncbi:hypothetical protein GPUN_1296 [Glaciecola punicea ACAM 611]|jgi:hypothetical protein|uniref:Lacal_2735 family protein n=1 Tax=Glaciecola punicea ACAM 611 TaxID=1121923 RepID=H5TAU3_9ALTE|nr:DUF6435 family protein [Glaciecola punicea]OFA31879.1 hypothetical protein BAE46_06430 [Glaciecola punicea]GAB55420.1 hypothetical protein GPUN_1296 [Glaciecola punicea ACAM 611]